MEKPRKHSQKPEIAKDIIKGFCGDLPRIELFARQKTEGWDVWGNEVESDIELMVN
jgi:N6-adenosine-specific RNA methylase IME4